MIDENKIKSKGPEKVTFVEMVAVSIQRLMNPAATTNDKKKAADGLLTLAKVLDKHPEIVKQLEGK
mgnify:CR=1 FL=1|tara:strand:- start:1708 stop:1905 length:198 start_codon:yes stop_codon:yes gene_type:complete